MILQLYKKPVFPYLLLSATAVISTIILWLPFIFKTPSINRINTSQVSFETVLKNWDGPLYIIPAKTNYDITNQILIDNPMGFEDRYFAAHLPLYPLTLKVLAPLVGFPRSTVLSTLLTTIGLICFFYFFVSRLKLSNHPLLLSLVFLFITPRFFVVRSVGSPEPLFLLLMLSSIYFFINKKYLFAGLLGGLATMTKSPGILLFITYLFLIILQSLRLPGGDPAQRGLPRGVKSAWLWILLIPTGLLIVFILYYFQLGDFWAYFNSGDNLHLLFPPFSVFNFQKVWVDTGWLEEIIFIYFFYLLALLKLAPFHYFEEKNSHPELVEGSWIKAPREWLNMIKPPGLPDGIPGGWSIDKSQRTQHTFFAFMLIFFLSIISIQHRDISRYSLPLLPFALIVFEQFFTSKKFLLALILLLPAIYAYAWNFMLYNVAPLADWTPFL